MCKELRFLPPIQTFDNSFDQFSTYISLIIFRNPNYSLGYGHDTLLMCREFLDIELYQFKLRSPERGKAWETISSHFERTVCIQWVFSASSFSTDRFLSFFFTAETNVVVPVVSRSIDVVVVNFVVVLKFPYDKELYQSLKTHVGNQCFAN